MDDEEKLVRRLIKETIEEMDPAEREEMYETVKRLWECFEEFRKKGQN